MRWCAGKRQAGAAHLPQLGYSVHHQIHPASLRPTMSGGKCAEPPVLHRKAQRKVADGCDGVQILYTTRVFHDKLAAAGMTQSMSRVGKCIDNGPMEGFWGILKRERYYGRKFTSREQLCRMVREYIAYYNFSRLQRRLGVHTPMEVFAQYRAA